MPANNPSPFDDASGLQALAQLTRVGPRWSVYDNVVATGTTISDAAPVPVGWILVTSGAVNAGIKLPIVSVGQIVIVANQASGNIKIYPHTLTDQILPHAAGDPDTLGLLSGGDLGIYYGLRNGLWYAY